MVVPCVGLDIVLLSVQEENGEQPERVEVEARYRKYNHQRWNDAHECPEHRTRPKHYYKPCRSLKLVCVYFQHEIQVLLILLMPFC